MNSYPELYKAWKEEKENVEIQKLPKNFYARIADYVKKIRRERRMLDEKTTKAKLLRCEHENVNAMISDLAHIRYGKIREIALTGKNLPREALSKEEEWFHGEIFPLAETSQTFIKDLLKGQLSTIAKKERPKKILLRFVREIPAIVGSDMKTYGPFDREDIATLPSKNARILIKQGVAVEVEVK